MATTPSSESLNQAIQSQQAEVARTKADQSTARSTLKDVEGRLAKAQQEIDRLRNGISTIDQSLQHLQQQQSALVSKREHLQQRVAEGLRSAYRMGGAAAIQTLLARSDALETERDLHYLRTLLQPTLNDMVALQQTRQALAANQRQLDQSRASLSKNHKELDAQLADWQNQKAEQVKLLASLDDKLQTQSQRLQQLLQQKRTLDAEVAAANRRPVKHTSAPEEPEPTPVDGRAHIPVDGKIIRDYGVPLGLGGLRSQGLVFSAPPDEPVRAVANGTVVYADHLKGWGNLVILRHRHNYLSLYAHNSSLAVHSGEQVRKGQIIGSTGQIDAHQTGVYFEVRHGDDTINPKHWRPWRTAYRAR